MLHVRHPAAGAPHALDSSRASYDSSDVQRVTDSKTSLTVYKTFEM